MIVGNGLGRPEEIGGITVEGENAGSLTVEIDRCVFRDNEKSHVQCANNSRVTVANCTFTGIGNGIKTTPNSGVQLVARNNEFIETGGAPI